MTWCSMRIAQEVSLINRCAELKYLLISIVISVTVPAQLVSRYILATAVRIMY